MSTTTKALKVVRAILGEEGPDDYLRNLGIVRQSPGIKIPEPKSIPGTITHNLLKGDPLSSEEDLDGNDLIERWADKRSTRGLRANLDTVEALLDDLGTNLDDYLEDNEFIYETIIQQVIEELNQSKGDPNGWFELLKASLSDEP